MNDEIVLMRPKDAFLYKGFVDFCKELKKHKVQKVLEIGSYIGESLVLFKEILGKDSIVICIDPFQGISDKNDILNTKKFNSVESVFNENSLKLDNYGKIKMFSENIADMFSDKYFDCVYIDGLHTYDQVKLDIQLFKNKTNKIMSGHDYEIPIKQEQKELIFDFEGTMNIRKNVSQAVREFYNDVKTFDDSSWMSFI